MSRDRTIRILHLSDLHFTADASTDREVSSWCDSLITDMQACLPRGRQDNTFIVISGDLTFSGQRSEFSAAAKFLRDLLSAIRVPAEHLLLVPGNHDTSRRDSSRWRRQAFFDCASGFLADGKNLHAPIRRFEKQGVVFLMPGVLEDSDPNDLSKVWRHIGGGHSTDLRVAITHYPLDWSPDDNQVDRDQDYTWWLESASKPFLAMATPHLHLFGHLHTERKNLWAHDVAKSFLATGSGPLSCESWRRELSGPPSYGLITVSGKKMHVRTRVYLAQSRRWVDDRVLPSIESSVDRPHASKDLLVERRSRDHVIDRLCALSQYDLVKLVDDLGAAVGSYSPVRESREDFAQRFVDYFAREDRLDYLQRCLDRFDQKGGVQKLRVLVLFSQKGRSIGRMVSKLCRAAGLDVVAPENTELNIGREELKQQIRTVDILFVVVAGDFSRSSWMAHEVGFALQHGGHLAPRIVPILMAGSVLPEPLKGLNAIEADSAGQIKPEKLSHAIRVAARGLLHSDE